MTAPELSPTEAAIVARFEAAPYSAEVLLSHLEPACTVYSHGADGWHCSKTGPHDVHRSAAGDVTW